MKFWLLLQKLDVHIIIKKLIKFKPSSYVPKQNAKGKAA